MVIRIQRKYTLEELPALIEGLEREPISPVDVERHRQLSKEVDLIRNAMPPIPVPVEEWIREEQERNSLD